MLYSFSKRQYAFTLTRRCSACGKFAWNVDFLTGDGTKISQNEVHAMARGAMAKSLGRGLGFSEADPEEQIRQVRCVCRNCGDDWACFSVGVGSPPPALRSGSTDERAEPGEEVSFEVIETHRSMEEIGQEIRSLDNSRSKTVTERTFQIEKKWARVIEFERGSDTGLGGKAGVSFPKLFDFSVQAEAKLSERYGISASETLTHTESVKLTSAANTHTEMVLTWKRIWQHGVIRALGQSEAPAMQFRVAVGVTFDQAQSDL